MTSTHFVLQSILVDYTQAADQISAIHEQLAKTEIYRGYRPVSIALSGVCGLMGSLFQPYLVPHGNGRAWVLYWGAVALCSGLVASSETAFNYLSREPEYTASDERVASSGSWLRHSWPVVLSPSLACSTASLPRTCPGYGQWSSVWGYSRPGPICPARLDGSRCPT